MHEFLTKNNLISPNQSGFKQGDSFINQLLSSLMKFTNLLTIVFRFDVWYKQLLCKLKQNGISGKLFDIITDFLNFRKERVVLNGQFSSLFMD